ncbi:helix-turn-helix domain-containing protein [Sphingomonas crusticola]|uniref:helix-turn-helix domain-containing protein n=1 Tax=Sphingomonas crusticola TaxID=1697973 RepID=UPI000E239F3E|nr:XRE family transcriptional regulator [Sphingomonas crusticola]
MATIPDRKLYLGPRIRVLRRELGINQTQMAAELGISPSYLNHIERNQRPLTAQMLVRLANSYDVDIRDFVSGAAAAGVGGGLSEALSDPLVQDIDVPRHEVLELGENYPGIAEALVRFHAALADLRRTPALVDQLQAAATPGSPLTWLGTFLAARRNHFPTMETVAEKLAEGLPDEPAQRLERLRVMLADKCGIAVQAMPPAVMSGALRHYDLHRKRLMLSERLPAASRAFAIAYQLALSLLSGPIEEAVARNDAPDIPTQTLLKIALANYSAAALLMPYARFAAVAEESRYDLDLLETRFGVSPEQAAQRLVTLDRAGTRGIPFFLIRVDRAGNVSKRLTGSEGDVIARLGEGCPRWRLHDASAGRWTTRLVEMPDGQVYVTLLRTIWPGGMERVGGPVTLALGCHARHAPRIACADGLRDPVTIGPGCRLCERQRCPDRAQPPVTRSLEVSSIHRAASPFPFRQV